MLSRGVLDALSSRKSSVTSSDKVPSRKSSVNSIDIEDDKKLLNDSIPPMRRTRGRKGHRRRFSNPTISATSLNELRLGIRSALGLYGVIDNFTANTSSRRMLSASSSKADVQVDIDDEFNPLRASAVLELMMAVIFVAPMMQSWDVYKKWQMLLFYEHKSASAKGRADDPDLMWFSDQVTFFDSYVVPLSNKIDECEVLHKEKYGYFMDLTMNNRRKWMLEGPDIIQKMVNEWDSYITEYDPF